MPRSGPGAGDRLAVDADGAGLDRHEAADQIEQGRLAAAGGPEQRDEFAVADLERHLVERQHLAPARRTVDVADAVDDDLRGRRHGGKKPHHQPRSVKRGGRCWAGRQYPIMWDTQPSPEREEMSVPDNLAEARRELALANRIVANEGVIDAFGHVSMRMPGNPNRYLLSRSRAPELVDARRLHRVRPRIASRCASPASRNIPSA